MLAWCPLLFAVALRRSRNVLLAAAWLLFLPNAPYVLTDFIHLGSEYRLYDTVLVGSIQPMHINVDEIQQKLSSPEYARVTQSLREIGFNSAIELFSTFAGHASQLFLPET